jgi:hypothetical protein
LRQTCALLLAMIAVSQPSTLQVVRPVPVENVLVFGFLRMFGTGIASTASPVGRFGARIKCSPFQKSPFSIMFAPR